MKITRFELLRGRFTYRDQASRRELKIMQNYSKMQHKSPRNEHEKKINSDRAMLKNARRRPTCKIASKRVRFCRSRCCFAHAMDTKIAQNHWNFIIKSSQKNTNAVVAMVRDARCRPTCEHASKRVDFCRSRCCFAHAMDAKIAQNHWKFTIK